jgi:3-phosphoshikimate 1-carboxyvinyltransferase
MSAPAREDYNVVPGGRLTGRLRVPGDKSISHRAIILSSIAKGTTEITGFLEGEDNLATVRAFRAMGVEIEGPKLGRCVVHGVGLYGLTPALAPLDLGNSGTSMRLLAGLLAGQRFDTELLGDASLSRRPMRRVTQPLSAMSALIETSSQGTAPLRVRGGRLLRGIDYRLPIASAQVKSSVLLAGLYAKGRTCVTEPLPTRDHTERMLKAFGCPATINGATVCIEGGSQLTGTRLEVPGDISSATFFLVGASIAAGSDLLLESVGVNPTRVGAIDILREMGADITLEHARRMGDEPVADIRVRARRLKGVHIPEALVPLAIDEFPALIIAAACAEGETVLKGAEELRVKESDRIQVMAEGLQALGIKAQPSPDGLCIRGGTLKGGRVQSHGDHRIAMAFAIAGLKAEGRIEIEDCANVETSFPGFVELARKAGLQVFPARN